jgi:hypothetical protein
MAEQQTAVPSFPSPPDGDAAWVKPVLSALNHFFELDENWDSYGARPIRPEAALETVRFLDQYMRPGVPLPSIVPTVRGGVQLEWHERGIDIEVGFGPGGPEFILGEDLREDIEWEWSPGQDASPLEDLLAKLARRA